MSPLDSGCTPNPSSGPPSRQSRDPRQWQADLSSLCVIGWRPLIITGLLRDLLIRHFADPSHIQENDLRHLLWQDDERTGILIESIHRWRGELVEKRPAILLKRNAYRSMRTAIGDRLEVNRHFQQTYSLLWSGSHTVFCVHRNGAGTEILSSEVQRLLTEFAPVMIEELGLFRFAVTEVGELSEVEEAQETFVVPIQVAWVYEESWRLDREAPWLRKLPITVLVDGQWWQNSI
jgi:hypothetical protein